VNICRNAISAALLTLAIAYQCSSAFKVVRFWFP